MLRYVTLLFLTDVPIWCDVMLSLALFFRSVVFSSDFLTPVNQVAILDESTRSGGVGATISAIVAEELYDELDAPVSDCLTCVCTYFFFPRLCFWYTHRKRTCCDADVM